MPDTIIDSFQMAQQNERLLFEALLETNALLKVIESNRKTSGKYSSFITFRIEQNENAMRKTMKISSK